MTLNNKIDVYFHMLNHYKRINQAKPCIDNKIPKGYENCFQRQERTPSRACCSIHHNWHRSSQNCCALPDCCTDFNKFYETYLGRSASVPPPHSRCGVANSMCSPKFAKRTSPLYCPTKSDSSPQRCSSRDQPSRSCSVPPCRENCNKSKNVNVNNCLAKDNRYKNDLQSAGTGSPGKKSQKNRSFDLNKLPNKKKKPPPKQKPKPVGLSPRPKPTTGTSKQKSLAQEIPTPKTCSEQCVKGINEPVTVKPTTDCCEPCIEDQVIINNLAKADAQEYLHFLLTITEDIIRNGIYTNKAIDKIINCHIEANKPRLDMDIMKEKVDNLIKQLKVPAQCSITDHIETQQQNCKCISVKNSQVFQAVLNKFSQSSISDVPPESTEMTESRCEKLIAKSPNSDTTHFITTVERKKQSQLNFNPDFSYSIGFNGGNVTQVTAVQEKVQRIQERNSNDARQTINSTERKEIDYTCNEASLITSHTISTKPQSAKAEDTKHIIGPFKVVTIDDKNYYVGHPLKSTNTDHLERVMTFENGQLIVLPNDHPQIKPVMAKLTVLKSQQITVLSKLSSCEEETTHGNDERDDTRNTRSNSENSSKDHQFSVNSPSSNNIQTYYVVSDIDDYKKLIGAPILKLKSDPNDKNNDYMLVDGLMCLKKSYMNNIVNIGRIANLTATNQKNVYKLEFLNDSNLNHQIPNDQLDWKLLFQPSTNNVSNVNDENRTNSSNLPLVNEEMESNRIRIRGSNNLEQQIPQQSRISHSSQIAEINDGGRLSFKSSNDESTIEQAASQQSRISHSSQLADNNNGGRLSFKSPNNQLIIEQAAPVVSETKTEFIIPATNTSYTIVSRIETRPVNTVSYQPTLPVNTQPYTVLTVLTNQSQFTDNNLSTVFPILTYTMANTLSNQVHVSSSNAVNNLCPTTSSVAESTDPSNILNPPVSSSDCIANESLPLEASLAVEQPQEMESHTNSIKIQETDKIPETKSIGIQFEYSENTQLKNSQRSEGAQSNQDSNESIELQISSRSENTTVSSLSGNRSPPKRDKAQKSSIMLTHANNRLSSNISPQKHISINMEKPIKLKTISSSSSSSSEQQTTTTPRRLSKETKELSVDEKLAKLISSEYDITPERDTTHEAIFKENSIGNLLLDEAYRIPSKTTTQIPDNFYKQIETQTRRLSLSEFEIYNNSSTPSLISIDKNDSRTDSILTQADLIENFAKIPSLRISDTQEMQIEDTKRKLELFRKYNEYDEMPVKRLSINLPNDYYNNNQRKLSTLSEKSPKSVVKGKFRFPFKWKKAGNKQELIKTSNQIAKDNNSDASPSESTIGDYQSFIESQFKK